MVITFSDVNLDDGARDITPVYIKRVRILNFYLTLGRNNLGRIISSIPGSNPRFMVCKKKAFISNADNEDPDQMCVPAV